MQLNDVVGRTLEWLFIAAFVLIAAGVIADAAVTNWDRVGPGVAMLTIPLASLFAQRARSNGGRLTIVGLIVLLVTAAMALALIPLGVRAAEGPVDLLFGGLMYVGAAIAVVSVVVSSRRRTLGGVDRDTAHRR